jgi:acetoin utilization protein AcuC
LHYDDPGVLTISLHESGQHLFPGSGSIQELGEDLGKGTALNVPLLPHTESESYLNVFDQVVPYALTHFGPDVIVAQCGADAHFKDPLADLLLTSRAYEALFRQLLDLADKHTNGRILCTLGGGYDLDTVSRMWALLALVVLDLDLPSSLPDDWREHWRERVDGDLSATLHDPTPSFNVSRRSAIEDQNQETSDQLLELVAPHWR